jgi:hypothetical protein
MSRTAPFLDDRSAGADPADASVVADIVRPGAGETIGHQGCDCPAISGVVQDLAARSGRMRPAADGQRRRQGSPN